MDRCIVDALIAGVRDVLRAIDGTTVLRITPSRAIGINLKLCEGALLEVEHPTHPLRLVLVCETRLLVRLVAVLLHQKIETLPIELEDSFNELANMIYGHFKRHASDKSLNYPLVFPIGISGNLKNGVLSERLVDLENLEFVTEFGAIVIAFAEKNMSLLL